MSLFKSVLHLLTILHEHYYFETLKREKQIRKIGENEEIMLVEVVNNGPEK